MRAVLRTAQIFSQFFISHFEEPYKSSLVFILVNVNECIYIDTHSWTVRLDCFFTTNQYEIFFIQPSILNQLLLLESKNNSSGRGNIIVNF